MPWPIVNSYLHCIQYVFSQLTQNWLLNHFTVFIVNLLGVRVFGELEFWFSSIKGQSLTRLFLRFQLISSLLVIALVGLLLFGIIIDLGERVPSINSTTELIAAQVETPNTIVLVSDTGKLLTVPWALICLLKYMMVLSQFSWDSGLPSRMLYLPTSVLSSSVYVFPPLLWTKMLSHSAGHRWRGRKPPSQYPYCYQENILPYPCILRWWCLCHRPYRSQNQWPTFRRHQIQNRSCGQSLRRCLHPGNYLDRHPTTLADSFFN